MVYFEKPIIRQSLLELGISPELPANIITEQGIKKIISISLCANALTEADIHFGTLTNLESFYIPSGDLSDSLAEEIGKNLKRVSELHLRNMMLTPGTWRGLGKLSNVSELLLAYCSIPDESFEDGTEISPTTLSIGAVPISETGLKKLIKPDNLENIFLAQTSISDDIASFFDECPKLDYINIEAANIQCLFVTQMRNTDSLRYLSLYDTNIDDDILAGVSRFPNLKSLSINGSKVSEASIPLLETLSKRLDKIVLLQSGKYLFYHNNDKFLYDMWQREQQKIENNEIDKSP